MKRRDVLQVCDHMHPAGPCGKPAPHTATASLGDLDYEISLCDDCKPEIFAALMGQGFSPFRNDRAEGRRRSAYVAASGRTFTAAEARPWLIERGLAPEKGRISETVLHAYGNEH